MRVIAGEYRHRKLEYPENNPNIRPTKDRIREAFFSSLGDITNKTFLDLCAGCGSMGIEAISRGAKKAIFVDNNKESLSYIRKNISSLNISNAFVLASDAVKALEEIKNKNEKIDIIYLDPPYMSDIYDSLISYIFNNNILGEGGVLAIERNKEVNLDPTWYSSIKSYHYGEISVIVLRK